MEILFVFIFLMKLYLNTYIHKSIARTLFPSFKSNPWKIYATADAKLMSSEAEVVDLSAN